MIRFALIAASTLGFFLTAALGNLMVPLLRAFQGRWDEPKARQAPSPKQEAPDAEPERPPQAPTMGGLCLMVGVLAAVGVGWTAACVAQPELLGAESLFSVRLLTALLGALLFGGVGLLEDLARIRRHRADRDGLGFETVEAGRNICAAIKDCDPAGSYLLDSVTALLLNELYPSPTASEPDPDGALRCRQELLELCDWVENAVFVSDYIYADGIAYDAYTENYRRLLAWIDRALAARCDTVLEVMSGNILLHKGELP